MRSDAWISLISKNKTTELQENHLSFRRIQQELSSPDFQQPQLIALIGHSVKSSFLQDIFGVESQSGHQQIRLSLACNTADTPSPILLADCELHQLSSLASCLRGPLPSSVEQHSLKWLQHIPNVVQAESLAHVVYGHLIMPFSTVTCIFADDFGGSSNVAKLVASWLTTFNSGFLDQKQSTYPRLVVLQRWKDVGATFDEKLATISFLKEVQEEVIARELDLAERKSRAPDPPSIHKLVRQQFGDVCVLPLPCSSGEILSLHPFLQRLNRRISQESQDVQQLRKAAMVSYSAPHFNALFGLACKHFASTIIKPFSLIDAVRIHNPVPICFDLHISAFLKQLPLEDYHGFGASVIASALCLDKFDPVSVFHRLYHRMLQNAALSHPHHPGILTEVRKRVEKLFYQNIMILDQSLDDTAQRHQQTLLSFSSKWKTMYSQTTCWSCLARSPEYVLSCGHSICKTCAIIHGRSDLEDQWTISILACPFCRESNEIKLRVKPATAGVRGLLLDGKGPDDMELLAELERRMPFPLSIREHFDIVLGSGTGAAIAVDLFCQETSMTMTAEKCLTLEKYQQLDANPTLKSRFSEATLETNSKDSAVWNQLKLKVSRASFPLVKSSIKKPSSSLFKQIFPVQGRFFGLNAGETKVSIASLQQRDNSLFLLSNYDGTQCARTRIIHSWQIVKAATSPKGYLGYKDCTPGLPSETSELIIRECTRIWSRRDRNFDVLWCLGTNIPAYEKPWPAQYWIEDFRKPGTHEMQSLIDKLLASLFYLELAGEPDFDEAGLICRAQVRCRLSPTSPAYRPLVRRLYTTRSRFYYNYQSVPCINRQIHDEATRGIAFSRNISFRIRQVTDQIDIVIDGLTTKRTSISNCPYRLQQLLADQGMYCVFGHQDHQRRYFGSGNNLAARQLCV